MRRNGLKRAAAKPPCVMQPREYPAGPKPGEMQTAPGNIDIPENPETGKPKTVKVGAGYHDS